MNKGLIVIWLLFFLAIFGTGYLLTGWIVTTAMNDYQHDKSQQ